MSTFRRHRQTIVLAAIIVVLLVAMMSLYTVREGEKAIRLRLGRIVHDSQQRALVVGPGLHFKYPLIEKVRRFDVRLQTFEQEPSSILTAEQKYVLVDYTVKWRIFDIALYYKRTGGFEQRATTLLEKKINNAMRAAFGQRTITEVVSGQRGDIMLLLKQQVGESARRLGINVIDVRIKRIDLPSEVRVSVFKRMSTQREQVAARLRSDGKAQAEVVRANADAVVTVTLAQAKADAAAIRAKGEAQAMRVSANAYGQDLPFYVFYHSLLIYQQSFTHRDNRNILLLSPGGRLLHWLQTDLP